MIEKKNAQTAFEFLSIVAFIMLFFTASFLVLSKKINQYQEYKYSEKIDELSNLILEEIELASKMEGSYVSTFSLPKKINNYNYTINISTNEMVIGYMEDEHIYYLPIPVEYSNISPGKNIIKKTLIE